MCNWSADADRLVELFGVMLPPTGRTRTRLRYTKCTDVSDSTCEIFDFYSFTALFLVNLIVIYVTIIFRRTHSN